MRIFNKAPSLPELTAMTQRNLAAMNVQRKVKSDQEAVSILREVQLPEHTLAYGFPNLLSAAVHLKEALDAPSVATLDTDGGLIPNHTSHYASRKTAVLENGSLLPSFFPSRLEPLADLAGLREMSPLIEQGLLRLLGISISSTRLPRQPLLREIYTNNGAEEYYCGLKRDKPPREITSLAPDNIWSQFLGGINRIGQELTTTDNSLRHFHLFDILPPIRPMAFNNGEEGIFAAFVQGALKRVGINVSTSLVTFNSLFPDKGMVMGKDLEYSPIS